MHLFDRYSDHDYQFELLHQEERNAHSICSMLRFLLVEAAQVTVRSLPEWRRRYFHLMMRRGRKIAKVAMARRLAVCLYWMMRQGWDYQQWIEFGSHVAQPGNRHGVQ